jgi:hypothetical protein
MSLQSPLSHSGLLQLWHHVSPCWQKHLPLEALFPWPLELPMLPPLKPVLVLRLPLRIAVQQPHGALLVAQ